MPRHVVQRLILMVGTLIGVLTVTFVLTHILPGSPVEVMLGHRPTPDQIQAAKHQLGLIFRSGSSTCGSWARLPRGISAPVF